ncbi:hypothetical protein JCM1840_001243 [Sporobolomyces johnsonii]
MHAVPLSVLSLAYLALSVPGTASSPLVQPRSSQPESAGVLSIPIRRRTADAAPQRDVEWYKKQVAVQRSKYGGARGQAEASAQVVKRAGTVSMTSYQDSEWYGEIDVGTPPVSFQVVLDTGSSDLILAQSGCTGCAPSTPDYDPSSSSTSNASSRPFSVTYGSGSASGTLVQDVVSIANYTSTSQTFASCDKLDNIVDGSISGLLGLGWQSIASSGATPLVQELAQSGKLPQGVFGFAFETHTFLTTSPLTAPGGTLTIGGVDTSQYSGALNWVNIIQPAGYWSIPLGGVSVGGTDLGITADEVVIDTGTTLIGMPNSTVASVYAHIPNSQATTLDGQSGYYAFPCSQNVSVSLTFGGVSYTIAPSQFNSGAVTGNSQLCLGAIYAIDNAGSQPGYIVGDAFLTGVYSAFRLTDPAAVGFAVLGSGGAANNVSTGPVTAPQAGSSSGASSTVATVGISLAAVVAGVVGVWIA